MAWRGVRELDPGGDGDDLQGADLPAAVRGLGAAVGGLDLPPGQPGELAAQPGLVALHRQHPVRAAGGRVATCSRWVCSASAVITTPARSSAGQGVEQRGERGDLVGLAVHVELAEHDSGCAGRSPPAGAGPGPVGAGVREPRRVLPSTASTRRRPGGATRRTAAGRTRPITASNRSASTALHAAGGSSTRTGTAGRCPARRPAVVGQVSDPLGDRDERARPGRDRAHRRRQHHHQPVADPAALARIGDRRPAPPRRLGASVTGSGSSTPPRCSAMAGIDKDADAGTVLFR